MCPCFSRESLCSVLLALELHLDEITKTGEKLTTYHEVTLKLDRQAEILKDAVNTPNHPLITMQDKLVVDIIELYMHTVNNVYFKLI